MSESGNKFDREFLKDLEDNKHLVISGISQEAIAIATRVCEQVKINHQPVQPENELPELIICAAAKDPDNNKVYISMRHGDEMFWQQLDAEYTHGDKNCCHFEQGFYTNKLRFVSREEAHIIAEQNNQIKRLCPTGSKRLYSEMLY